MINNKKLWLLLLCLYSCQKGEQQYRYCQQLADYLQKEFDFDVESRNEILLVMLPLNSCNPCLKSTITMLNRNHDKNFVLYIGGRYESRNGDLLFDLSQLMQERELIIDEHRKYDDYEIGLKVPLIIHFVEGKCVFSAETSSNNTQKIKTYLNWR